MKLDGLNTYDPTQIRDSECKFTLNCYNRNGVLQGYNYQTEFDIPLLPIYQRKYSSSDFNQTGPDSVVAGSPRFLHETDTEVRVSGLVKPDVSVFVDTTKFDTGGTSNYLRKAGEFNVSYHTGGGTNPNTSFKPLLGDELHNAMRNYGKDCEVYRDVEIAVSYSGPYGESGLSKFRITSNILHFFTVVHGIDEYIDNPNYKYVNVYVKFAAYTELQLLHRILITDLLDATDNQMNIKTDDNDKKFYLTYNTDELDILETTDDGDTITNVLDSSPDSAMINSNKNKSTIIYSGLFQFENENYLNPSWFVNQKVVPISPLVDTETHTYISSEDYDIERNVNEYLDSRYERNDNIATNVNQTPLLTSDYSIDHYIDGEYMTDIPGRSEYNQMQITSREWLEKSAGTLKYYNRNIHNELKTNVDIYGRVFGWNEAGINNAVGYSAPQSFDLYNGLFTSGDEPGKLNQRDTVEFIVQYINGEVMNTSEVAYTEAKYFTLHFDDIVSSTIDDSIDWQIDIWVKSDDAGDIYYRVMSLNVNDCYTAYDAAATNGPVDIDDEDQLLNASMRYSYSNIGRDGSDANKYHFPLRDFGCTENLATGKLGLFVVMNVGTIIDEPDEYDVGTFTTGTPSYLPLSDDINFTDDIEDILYNPDGRNQDDYSTYQAGLLNRPDQNNPKWDIDVNHIEEYDGRLFMSSRERRDNTISISVIDIVPTLPNDPSNGDLYLFDDGVTDVEFWQYEDGWSIVTFNSNLFYNQADTLYYKIKTDLVERNVVEVYEEFYTEYKNLYYSQQGYPEVVLETNYKGYSNIITGLWSFISQLYVFMDNEISVIRKSLTRQDTGIIEPTYQFDKSFDKGCIEWTIGEYEKKLYFTNEDGIFYIDAGGNYNKISAKINNLFDLEYITPDTVDYATIKDEFYVLKLKETIPFNVFSDLEIPYSDSRLLYGEYIAYHIPTDSFWMGNDVTGSDMWFYMSKDFTQRNKYENEFVVKQNKRISFSYEDGKFRVVQIRNGFSKIGEIQYNGNSSGMPVRHTLNGARCATYSFLISSEFTTKMRDFMLIENGK